MLTLKKIILVKLAARFINDSDSRKIINCSKDEIWEKFIKEKTSAFYIPLTLQEDIIALIKPLQSEVHNFTDDHAGIFTEEQEWSLKFCFNADGTVDRVKTADLLIHSKWLDVQTRFVLACQYWSSLNVQRFFYGLHKSTRKKILNKYSTENENLNQYEENVVLWIRHCKAGYISEWQTRDWCYKCYTWNYASFQSRHLDNLTEEERQSTLYDIFEESYWVHIHRFCLSRMSADDQESLLKRFPLKVLRTYLYWPSQRFFLDAVNKVWHCLPGNHFTCLLHIIICQKILELWKDFDYVNLLRQLWHRSPDHLKQCVEGTDIFEILMEILKNGFNPKDVPGNFFLHDDIYDNANEYQSQSFRSSASDERQGEQGKKTSLAGNQGGKREPKLNNSKRSRGSNESILGLYNKKKKSRHEVTGCERRNPLQLSERPQRKNRGPERQLNNRGLPSSHTSNSNCPLNKKLRQSKESFQKRETGPYHLRSRNRVTKEKGFRSLGGKMQVQGGPFRSIGERFKKPSPYNQSRHYRQQSKHQGRHQPEQEPRNGRSSSQSLRKS
ncbi:uncharacterized protein TNIN_223731 [Trichonephila inaurata madagascariensis]|uniref:Uncharacterized protein n=1 Tax=Trichonephila inaurata madagascariensis TaxID=2747483 RepID=A0A8X7CH41_9ARAC|nr:uncharacterized protein TNIN_223731 [Trichonephila inaurata madagascariensis]